MSRWITGAAVLPVMGLMADPAAAGLEPHLWRCDGEVKVNDVHVACDKSSEMPLKFDDKIELVRGTALITGWDGERLAVSEGSMVRIPARPAQTPAPSVLRRLQMVLELLFGGTQRSALMKADTSAKAIVQPKLIAPESLVLTAWKGEVRWQMPKDRPLALRVRRADGALDKPLRMLKQPAIELSELGLGGADKVTLELLVLDHVPEPTASYLSLPPALALRQAGRPVIAVVSTELRRVSPAQKAADDKALNGDLAGLPPMQVAARLLAAGEIGRARSATQLVATEGLPEPWERSLSGVRVEVAP
ncbi:MAG: hypothetical protein U0359_15060 [Byssovorax sp.]